MNSKFYIRLLLTVFILFSINLFTVLAAPTVENFTKTGIKNTTINFLSEDFESHLNVGEGENATITFIKIVSLPQAPDSTFVLSDNPITAGQEIAAADIPNIAFTPATDWIGKVTFEYQVKTDNEYSNTGEITLDIVEPPVNPLSVEDLSIVTKKNVPVDGQLIGNSENEEPFEFVIVNQPTKGSVQLTNASTGTFTYTPNTDELGNDSFSFKIKNENFESEEGNVFVTIEEDTEILEPIGFHYVDMLGHWGEYSAIKLAKNEAIIGEQIANDYFFYPEKIMKRGDFILLANAAIGYENLPEVDPTFKFADDALIPPYLKTPAYKAYAAGIIKGSLQPDGSVILDALSNVNRIETIVILNNIMNPEAQNEDELNFADNDIIPEWSKPYVRNVKGYGLIKGYEDNTLRPFNNITKAESAEMLYQLMKYLGKYPETIEELND